MTKVIGVRFKSSGRIYYFDPLDMDIHIGDGVIVETARGQEFGEVAQGITEVEDTMVIAPLKPVMRLATAEDCTMRASNSAKESDAFIVCQQKIAQHKLDMKLVDVEYAYNGSKVVFYFTADERVDFRELVKDLASQFRTRIELRQIGVRDEAKMLGGLGSCGRPVCCKTFLDDFRPVSIKMAKEQSLSLSPTKISGLCGRLMCCLQYEQASYEEMKRRMPKTNREVLTPDGPGIAIENNAITEKTRVRLTLADGTIEVRSYHYEELAAPGEPLPQRKAPVPKEAPASNEPAPNVSLSQSAEATGTPQSGGEQGGNAAKRRRRGGRGHGNGSGNGNGNGEGQRNRTGEPNAQNGEQKRAQSGEQRPQQRRPQQPRPQQPKPQQPQQKAQPPASRQGAPAGEQGVSQNPNPNPNHRRRRRGGQKPKTQQPAE